MSNSAKQQAIKDIKDDLERNGKCFLAFRTNLDNTMERLVDNQAMLQLIKSIV